VEEFDGDGNLIDLAIIGGGPAGAAAALEARRRGLEVAIFEKDCFPRDKVCGEFISAESAPFLESVIPAAMARAVRIERAEFISRRGSAHGFLLPASARGLSRRVMDEALWRQAALAGATGRDRTAVWRVRRVMEGSRSAWEIESSAGVQRARALIVACGRWWKIEGLDSPAGGRRKPAAGEWLGAKAHFRGIASRGYVEIYYFPGGYCGVAPIEDGLHNACCLVHRSAVTSGPSCRIEDFRAWIGAVSRHPLLAERLSEGRQEGETATTAPVRPARRRAVQGEILFAGDAAGFLDPFTGDGISMALSSGRLAAEESARFLAEPPRSARLAGLTYEKRLTESVRRSYAVAGALRALVRAPESVQDAAAAILFHWGSRLHAETRWKSGHGAAEIAPSS
jgi:flavin-dependent dehydrogenase